MRDLSPDAQERVALNYYRHETGLALVPGLRRWEAMSDAERASWRARACAAVAEYQAKPVEAREEDDRRSLAIDLLHNAVNAEAPDAR